jgi:hypothetical protein
MKSALPPAACTLTVPWLLLDYLKRAGNPGDFAVEGHLEGALVADGGSRIGHVWSDLAGLRGGGANRLAFDNRGIPDLGPVDASGLASRGEVRVDCIVGMADLAHLEAHRREGDHAILVGGELVRRAAVHIADGQRAIGILEYLHIIECPLAIDGDGEQEETAESCGDHFLAGKVILVVVEKLGGVVLRGVAGRIGGSDRILAIGLFIPDSAGIHVAYRTREKEIVARIRSSQVVLEIDLEFGRGLRKRHAGDCDKKNCENDG